MYRNITEAIRYLCTAVIICGFCLGQACGAMSGEEEAALRVFMERQDYERLSRLVRALLTKYPDDTRLIEIKSALMEAGGWKEGSGDSLLEKLADGKIGKSLEIKLPGDVPMIFSYCPPGKFMMGSPSGEEYRSDREDQVLVEITKGFWLLKTELMQEQWKTVEQENPSCFSGNRNPVDQVTWDQAAGFAASLNKLLKLPPPWRFALPTAAQWEYACRAGTTTAFSFGEKLGYSQAHFGVDAMNGNGYRGLELVKTLPAASYPPNPWGFYDMHGNVAEWCADWGGELPVGGKDPMGPATGTARIGKGGSWQDVSPAKCRSAFRGVREPDYKGWHLGFRLAIVAVE